MAEINLELLEDFIEESREHLDEMESLLLQLGNDLDSIDILNEIFRTMHNVKGASQMTGLVKISRLSHRLEDLLDNLRQSKMKTTPEMVMLLISGHDKIIQIISELEKSNQEESDVDHLVNQVNAILDVPISEDAPQIPTSGIDDIETYQEQDDQELFTIFISQLEEQCSHLTTVITAFESQGNESSLLECKEVLSVLKSSANYMGYEEIVAFFDDWIFSLDDSYQAWKEGESISLDFMTFYLEDLFEKFPQVDIDKVSEPSNNVPTEGRITAVQAAFDRAAEDTIEQQNVEPESKSAPVVEESKESDMVIDLSLLEFFIEECREHLDEMEGLLLNLVSNSSDLSLLDDVFRTMHNVKGSSQLTGIAKVSKLAHRLEDLLDLLRTGEMITDKDTIDLLIRGRDQLVTLVDELERTEQELSDVDDLVRVVSDLIARGGDLTENVNEPVAAPEMTTDNISLPKTEYIAPLKKEKLYLNEENDKQLFEIFLEHLQDQLSTIKILASQLDEEPNSPDKLRNIHTVIMRLRSSANYMGYDDLMEIYQQWEDELDDAMQLCSQGGRLSTAFITVYLAQLLELFPSLNFNAGSSVSIPEQQPVTTAPMNETAVAVQSYESADDIANRVSHSTGENVMENSLATRLSTALESSLQNVSTSEHEALNEVFDELMSSQADSKKEVKEQKIEQKQALSPVKAREVQEQQTQRAKSNTESTDKKLKKTVRVDAEKIDILMNQVGELVVDRSYFFQLYNEMRELQSYLKDSANLDQKDIKMVRTFTYRLGEAISGLGRTSNELQEGVMKMRMLPVSNLFNRYPRLVHDLTNNLDKKVNLIVRGEETELDRMIVEELSDPLIHIIRNSIDHGIETPEERKATGKSAVSNLILEAYQESNHIVIQVTDDGRGLNPEKIKEKAVKNGLYTQDVIERMTEREVTNLILLPGFSTADKISDTSGRGVGMDVVKTNIEKLNGTLDIDSTFGRGTQMRLKIPLTLAIIHALMIRVGKDIFTIPLANVDETVRINQHETSNIEGVEVIYLRGIALPIFRLSSLFKVEDNYNMEKSFVVIVNTDGQRVGFVVDELLGQEEVVIKPLEDYVQERSGFSGATVIGDGRISLILDVYDLVKMTTKRHSDKQKKRTEMIKAAKPKLGDMMRHTDEQLH